VPEGHTIRRLARTHTRRFVGHEVAVSSPQGRFARDAELVDGRVLRAVDAHGKHLFHVYADDLVVHVHLGLYGRFTTHSGAVTPPRGQVRMRLVGPTHWADLRGPIACEVIGEVEVEALRSRLGPDPLRPDADPEAAWARIARMATGFRSRFDAAMFTSRNPLPALEALPKMGQGCCPNDGR